MTVGLVNIGFDISMKPLPPRRVDVALLFVGPVLVILASAGLAMYVASVKNLLIYHYVSQILVAAGIAVVSAILGAFAVTTTWRNWPEYLPQGVLAAITIRLLVTMGAVLAVVLVLPEMRKVFLLSTAGFYILGLIIETILAIKVIYRSYVDGSEEEKVVE